MQSDLRFISFSFFRAAFFFLLLTTHLPAQSPAFFRYDASSGLSCNEVYDVLQDHSGFIWIATDRGVYRYDGYEFLPFTTAQGLTDNTVFYLEEDSKGRIWAMPFSGGLCYIEDGVVKVYPFNDSLAKYLPGIRIARSLSVLPSGGLRIGYLEYGIVEVSENGIVRKVKMKGNGRTGQYYEAMDAGAEGLAFGVRDENAIPGAPVFSFRTAALPLGIDLPLDSVGQRLHMVGIRRGKCGWCFAVRQWLISITPGGHATKFETPFQPLSLYEDRDGFLWVGTDGGGVLRYDANVPVTESTHHETFYAGEQINSILQDREGGFWLGTLKQGLFYVPDINTLSWKPTQQESDYVLNAIPANDGRVFLLWRDAGLFVLEKDSLKPAGSKPGGGLYYTMAYDSVSGILAVSSLAGTEYFEGKSLKLLRSENFRFTSLAFSSGRIYAGASWLLKYAPAGGPWKILGSRNVRHRPEYFYTDRSGTLWMGALDGLYTVHDTTIVSCSAIHPLFSKRISSICELADSTLVVATQSNGIALLKNGKVRELNTAAGLPTNHVLSVVAAENKICWVTTTDGIFRVDCANDSLAIACFTTAGVLLNGEGRCFFADRSGKLWIGTGNRLIHLVTQLQDQPLPPVYILNVANGERNLSAREETSLQHDRNSLRIHFAALSYRMLGHIQYRYRLNADEEWKYTFQNTVDLAALEPGSYNFEVEAQNQHGAWSNPAVYRFSILPAFWQTWWFRVTIALAILAVVLLLVRYRFRQLRRRNQLREQALIFRQQALASQMSPHFVFNTLNTIQAYVLKEDKTKALEMFSSFAVLLRKSFEHVRERYVPLSEEVAALELYCSIEKMRFGERLNYSISGAAGNELLHIPSMLIQPLVENAIRHGLMNRVDGGNVDIRFFRLKQELICEVEDDGVGRKAAAAFAASRHRSAGSDITRDRLRVLNEMNGTKEFFEIIDKSGNDGIASGTLVRFSIPYETTTGTDRR